MAEITIAGGAVIDVATRSDLDQHHDKLSRLFPPPAVVEFEIKPTGQPSSPNGVATTRPLVLDFGGPPAGNLWLIEWITVIGNDALNGGVTTAIANVVAAVFIGPPVKPDALVPSSILSDNSRLVVPAFAVPSTQQLPDKAFVRGQDHLYVLVGGSGVVAGSAFYRATAGVLKAADRPEIIAQL